ncbi:MAG: sugar ABC transporter permease [Lachnospiraceae bacterium]|nr:sugar ABC transporter permease [Lachnospiraceae bacterium]
MKSRKLSLEKSRSLYGFLFVLPGLLGFFVFVFIPLLFTLYYSMFDGGGSFDPIGNITSLFRSRSFLIALRNTGFYVLVGGGLAIVISFVLAWLLFELVKRNVKGSSVIKVGYLMPMVLSSAVSVLFVELLFQYTGVINQTFGTTVDWLTTSPYTFWLLVLLYIWKNFGYNVVIFLVAFTGIDPAVYEAAKCDGAGTLRILHSIVIPQITPSFFFVLIMSIIGVFKMNRESYLLFGDYPSESAYMFQNFINNNLSKLDYNRAACSAMILFVLFAILVTFIVSRTERTDA